MKMRCRASWRVLLVVVGVLLGIVRISWAANSYASVTVINAGNCTATTVGMQYELSNCALPWYSGSVLSPATIGVGQSGTCSQLYDTGGGGNYPFCLLRVQYSTNAGGGPPYFYSAAQSPQPTMLFYIYPNGTNYVTNNCASVIMVNSDSVGHNYSLFHNSSFVRDFYLGPGQGFSTNYCCTNCGPQMMWVDRSRLTDGMTDQTITGSQTNTTGVPPSGPFGPTNSATGGQLGGQWDGSSVPGITNEGTGFSAVFDAISKGGVQQHQDMIGLTNMLRGEFAATRTTLTNTGNVSVTVTNSIIITNSADGGPVLSESMTNKEAAESAAVTALGSWVSRAAGMTNSVESARSAAAAGLVGSGSASALSMEFCGYTLNFDPAVRFPGLLEVIKAAWTFILLVLFLWWLVGYLWSMVKGSMMPASTLNAANIVPGAVASAVIGLALPAVAIAWWLGAFNWASDVIEGWVSQLITAAGALSLGGNGAAVYLLNESFPVALAIELAMLRIAIPIAGWLCTAIFRGAARFLLAG